jgi:type III restriction enzyme
MTTTSASPGAAIRRLGFQENAARQVAARYARHAQAQGSGVGCTPPTPFFQAFAVITLLGKTLVLGDAVTRIAESMPARPVVLWLSRGRVLAQTTYNTLQHGGRYDALLAGGAPVAPLGDFAPADLETRPATLVYFGTIGTFSGAEPADAGFSLARSDIDAMTAATHDALRRRRGSGGRRPLILVYDEAHELSDEHAEAVMSLEPDVLLLASSTMRMPRAIATVAGDLKRAGWRDEDLTTIPRSAWATPLAT